MIGLKTARVIVVDNNWEEAEGMLRALSKAGISSIYFSGKVEDLPPAPGLKGIRLVALDLNLASDDLQESPAMLGTALSVLGRLIDPDNGPFVVLAWTKHSALVGDLRQKLPIACPAATPPLVFSVDKPSVKTSEGDYDLDKILAKLESGFQQWTPFDVLLYWEQLVHDSASETTKTLSSLSPGADVQVWKDSLSSTLHKLGKASIGAQQVDDPTFLRGILETLHPAHYDRLENSTGIIPAQLITTGGQLKHHATQSTLDIGAINRMLHLVSVPAGATVVRPGNLYGPNSWHSDLGTFPVKCAELIDELLEASDGERLKDKCLPILLEITPACDFSQNKNRMARLIGGLLIPATPRPKYKAGEKPAYMYVLGPFHVKAEDNFGISAGEYALALSARYLFGYSLNMLCQCQAIARARRQVVVDLQAWFASHAARPGVTSLS